MKQKTVPEADKMERLLEAVEQLTAEVKILHDIIDRLQDDFEWSANNDPRRERHWMPTTPPMHITSIPLDPLAPDFGKRINRFRPEDLPPEILRQKKVPDEPPPGPGRLF